MRMYTYTYLTPRGSTLPRKRRIRADKASFRLTRQKVYNGPCARACARGAVRRGASTLDESRLEIKTSPERRNCHDKGQRMPMLFFHPFLCVTRYCQGEGEIFFHRFLISADFLACCFYVILNGIFRTWAFVRCVRRCCLLFYFVSKFKRESRVGSCFRFKILSRVRTG